MVLKNDGSVWATGSNKHGQLGLQASKISEKAYVRVVQINNGAVHDGVLF